MSIDEAYTLITNGDFDVSRRRFGPKHSLVHFNRMGEVVGIERFSENPTEEQKYLALAKYSGCLQISAEPSWFTSATELAKRIASSMWLFEKMKPE